MKSLKAILVPLVCLVVVILLIFIKIWQREVILETTFPNPLDKHETNLLLPAGFRSSVRFEPNLGQTNIPSSFIARGKGYRLFLQSTEAVFAFQNTVTRLHLEGSNPNPRAMGSKELPGRTNYFIGNDPANWLTNIPNYARVEYKEVYPGIDLVYYGNEGELEYDFIIASGGNPHDILLKFDRNAKPKISNDGSLVISVGKEEMIMKPPWHTRRRKGKGITFLLNMFSGMMMELA